MRKNSIQATLLTLGLALASPWQTSAQEHAVSSTSERNVSQASQKPRKKRGRPPLDVSKTLKIIYGLPSWNEDSSKIDVANIYMRDARTGRLVKINLEETAPDSSTFTGTFSIHWGNIEEITPEIYVSRRKITNDNLSLKFIDLIKRQKVPRKAFVLRRDEKGMQIIDVYDTKEQAYSALNAYKQQQRLEAAKSLPVTPPKLPGEKASELAKIATKAKQLELEAAQREIERVRLQQLEAQRELGRQKEQARLNRFEKQKQANNAKLLAQKAMELYKAGQFLEAQKYFEKSLQLDPNSKEYYYRYGVTLYKNGHYNQSIVVLKRTDSSVPNRVERDYFLGLNHYRMNEFEEAKAYFVKVKQTREPTLAPSAAFYSGVIDVSLRNYNSAKDHFQFVLDTSKDPLLDQRAEDYIERIARLQNFERLASQRWDFKLSYGLGYDSNVLLQSDSEFDQGTATDAGGIRSQLQTSVNYRAIYEKNYDWNISTSLNYYFSHASNNFLSSHEDLGRVDPLTTSLSFPYKRRGLLWGKGYQFSVEPGYDHVWMGLDAPSSFNILEYNFLDSYYLNTSHTFIMEPNWYSNYQLNYRQNNALYSSSSGDDDATSNRIQLLTSQTYFLDRRREKAWQGELGVTLNNAKGDNLRYMRYDLAFSYLTPSLWKTTINTRLGYYLLSYSDKSPKQTDNNFAITAVVRRPINDWSLWALLTNYTLNSSDQDSSTYRKYLFMISYTANFSF